VSDSQIKTAEVSQPGTAPRRRNLAVWIVPAVLSLAWLVTGVYVVGTDEVAVVRVFGNAQRDEAGNIELKPSGLYFHLPWPLTSIDRVRINESRTLVVGTPEIDNLDSSEFLAQIDPARQSELLSGDKNILNVQINLQYRISRERIDEWLFQSTVGEQRLRLLAGSVLADVVMRCGVDFVHTLGHAEIRRQVLARIRELSHSAKLGVEVDDVTVASVTPPVRVKSEFVDVMNARADRETYIQRARAYGEQKKADADATRRQTQDQATAYARQTTEAARAEATSFDRLIQELELAAATGPMSYEQVRQMALRRQYVDTISDVYRRVAGKVLLDSGQPVDLTIHRNPSGR
jgi:modulator of FtsH protease HflK